MPKYDSVKTNLLTMGLVNDVHHLSNEIAIIFGNRSLVMLKERYIDRSIQDAQQSLTYFPTAKVIDSYVIK